MDCKYPRALIHLFPTHLFIPQDHIRQIKHDKLAADPLIAACLRAWQAHTRELGKPWSATVVSGDWDFLLLGPRPGDTAPGMAGRLVLRMPSGKQMGWVPAGEPGTWRGLRELEDGDACGGLVDGDAVLRYQVKSNPCHPCFQITCVF